MFKDQALTARVPLIGFSGVPWTLACYMVEVGGSDDYRHVKSLMYSRPDLMHRLLQINADAVALYLNTQIEAGAQAVMVFDSWGGVLADGMFQTFSMAYTARVLSQLKRSHEGNVIPSIVFTKGGGLWLPEMAELDCDVLGLDWTVNLGTARAEVGGKVGGKGKMGIRARFKAARIPDCRGLGHEALLEGEIFQRTAVDVFERLYFGHSNMLVNFMDARIGWAKLHHLRADLRNEATI